MHPLPEGIITILTAFAPLFSDRVWQHAQVLLLGAILTPGKRTVSSVLSVMGLSKAKRFANYHRVLKGSRILLGLLVYAFCPTGWVVLGVDETIERRSGKKIAQIGCYRDGARSTKNVVIRCFGLKCLSKCRGLIAFGHYPFSRSCVSLIKKTQGDTKAMWIGHAG